MINLTDPLKTLAQDLKTADIAPNRLKGQNFLISESVRNRISDAAFLSEKDKVIEIGPGTGVLTWRIIASGAQLVALELEKGFSDLLTERYKVNPGFKLIHGDALEHLETLLLSVNLQPAWKIVANLPYGISSPVLLTLAKHSKVVNCAVIMLQKEVVERVIAPPGNTNRGALSVLVQDQFFVKNLFNVKKSKFYPPPKVESAVLKLERTAEAQKGLQSDQFKKFVFTSFASRRKTILNNLKTDYKTDLVKNALDLAEIDPKKRAQDLNAMEFRQLFYSLIESKGITKC